MSKRRYPRMLRLPYPATAPLPAVVLIFVEEGGVRLDNAGPLPPRQARRLRDWLTRYLRAQAEADKRYRAARMRQGGR